MTWEVRLLDKLHRSIAMAAFLTLLLASLVATVAALSWEPTSIATAPTGTYTNPVKSDGADP